jgi:hypothetical protein
MTLAACMAASTVLAGPVSAQDYPTHPIKIIASFPPGGGVDLVARIMASEFTKTLHQPVIVENKPGAAGTMAGMRCSGRCSARCRSTRSRASRGFPTSSTCRSSRSCARSPGCSRWRT